MRGKFPVGFRAWCVALVLCCGLSARAAEPHPLLGASREQVLSRYGEPKSTLVGANRELFFYERERLTLRDGVVVEVEPVAAEPTRRPTPPPSQGPATEAAPAPAASGTTSTPPAETTPPPVAPPAAETSAPSSAATTSAPPPPAEPKIAIKRVLPPGASFEPTAPKKDATPRTTAPAPATKATPKAAPVAVAPGGPGAAPAVKAPTPPVSTSNAAPAIASTPTQPSASNADRETTAATTPPAAETPEPEKPEDAADSAKKDTAKKILDARAARRRLEQAEAEAEDPTASLFTARTYVLALAIIGGGIAYLVWRRRQRQLELAATAVSRTPFNVPTPVGGGAVFKADLISKLEWKRFEELVAAYYSKTGVVATRTKSGPNAPVHIKISWKGEPRPFALVQCLAQPNGLVDAKPVQDLFAVLTTEDIRRGYVVTTGKFNVAARDFAEEKHITLLPGDIFLEKLNALPDAARSELMQQVTTGDYTTPSCPKCEAKMVRSGEDPAVWRCVAHPDQQVTMR